MGDAKMIDMMVGALTDPFDTIHMGVTAEKKTSPPKCSITREQQDAFAVQSHQRAGGCDRGRHFKSQILAIELKGKKGPVMFDTDEHVARRFGPSKAWASFAPCSRRRTAASPPATRPQSTMLRQRSC